MKTTGLVLGAGLMLSASTTFSQEAKEEVKGIRISTFYLHQGAQFTEDSEASFEDFQGMLPESQLLKEDYSEFTRSLSWSVTGNVNFLAMIGMQFRNREKTGYRPGMELRLGLGYQSGAGVNHYLYWSDRVTFDTLVSAQTGRTIFVDSVQNKGLSINYYSDEVRLDASLLFRTPPQKRTTAFAGLGIGGGVTINPVTSVSYYQYNQLEMWNDQGTFFQYGMGSRPSGDMGNDISIEERYKQPIGYSATFYIPAGIDRRFSVKDGFFRMLHLYYEIRPSLTVRGVPDLGTFVQAGLGHGFGIRVLFAEGN